MSKRFIPVVAVLALLAASPIAAQTCTGVTSCTATQTASLTIPSLVSLDLGVGTYTLTQPVPGDLAAGYKLETAAPNITVRANKAWTLSVMAAAPNFTAAGGLGVRARGRLYWANAVGADLSTYTAMTGSAATVDAGAATNGATPQVFYASSYASSYADPSNVPDTYTLALTFTLAAP
jgi:hypothetical protein